MFVFGSRLSDGDSTRICFVGFGIGRVGKGSVRGQTGSTPRTPPHVPL